MGNYCFQCEEIHDHCKAHAMVEKKVVKVTTRKVAAAKAALTIDDLLGRPHDPRVVAIASARRGDTVAPVICSDCNTESLYDPCHWCQELRTTKQRIEEREREREIQRVEQLNTNFEWGIATRNAFFFILAITPIITLGWFWYGVGWYESIATALTWSFYHQERRIEEIEKAKTKNRVTYWDFPDDDPSPEGSAFVAWSFMNIPLFITILIFLGAFN